MRKLSKPQFGFTQHLASRRFASVRQRRTTAKLSAGFTVIELLIATAVFSLVLLVFLSAFLRISQLFYKGVNLSNTQEAARKIVQNISNDIQFYKTPPTFGGGSPSSICIGSHRYSWELFKQYTPGGSGLGLLEENLSGCPATNNPVPDNTTGVQLLNPGMQLNKFSVLCNGNLCDIKVRVVFYGSDPTVLSPSITSDPNYPNAVCSGASESTQYCATAEYDSTVLQE
jgi:prepilin-type N-terminal cleavage/methylation domain-containing protein